MNWRIQVSMSIMISHISVLIPMLMSLNVANNEPFNVDTCCPLTSVHMRKHSDVIYEHYTSFEVGNDHDGPTHLAFHKDVNGYLYTGSKRPMPITRILDDGTKVERSYSSRAADDKDQLSHNLLTNDKKCVTGWERVSRFNNYWRKDSMGKHYPEFDGDRFAKIFVTSNNDQLTVIGYTLLYRKDPVIWFSIKPGEWKSSNLYNLIDSSWRCDLFYVNCVESVKKLLRLEIVTVNTNGLNVTSILAKKSSNVQFYTSERIVNNSPVEFMHTFKKIQENEIEIQDTTNSSLRDVFNLDVGRTAGLSFLGLNIGGSVDTKQEETETSKSKTTKTIRKETIEINRTIKVPPYSWIQLQATMDKIDNARIPYEATYRVSAQSSLTNSEIIGMLRGVGYDGLFDTNSNDDLLIYTNGYMDVKAGTNIKIVVNGDYMQKRNGTRSKRSLQSSPYCYVVPCQRQPNSTIGKLAILLHFDVWLLPIL